MLVAGSSFAWAPAARSVDPVGGTTNQQTSESQIRARIAEAKAKIAELDGRQAELTARLLAIETEAERLGEQQDAAVAQSAEARADLETARAGAAAAGVRQRKLRSAIEVLTRLAYESARTSLLERLLMSDDLFGFVEEVGRIGAVQEELGRQVSELEAVRAEAADWADRARRTIAELDELRQETAERAAALEQVRLEARQLQDSLAEEEIARRSEIAVNEDVLLQIGLTRAQALAEQEAIARKERTGATGASGAPPIAPNSAAPAGTAANATAPPPEEPDPVDPSTRVEPAGPTPTPEPTGTPAATLTPAPTPTPAPTAAPTPAPTSTPAPTTAPAAPVTGGSIRFYGRGTDHGLGLSQWGAYGRARAGQGAADILAAYYQGTTVRPVDPTQIVRVLLLRGFEPSSSRPARLRGLSGPWTIDGTDGVFPAGATLDLERVGSATWRALVRAADGSTLADRTMTGTLMIRPASAETRLEVVFKPSYYDTYRGSIRIYLQTSHLTVVNDVPLDEYLLGVVPAEVSATWPQEAVKAQAVAARSYAVSKLHPDTGAFDVYDTAQSQVYLGALCEKSGSNAAVEATRGQVLFAGSTVASALFHSTAGGATENNENVYLRWDGARLSSPVSYLRGISDRAPDGSAYDAGSTSATWQTAMYTLDQLSGILARDARTSVGQLTSIDLSRRGVSGRLITVTLTGSAGTKTVSGPYFKYVFNIYSPSSDPPLRSTLFDVAPIP